MRLQNQLDFADQKDKFQMMLSKLWRFLASIINQGITFGDGTSLDNINGFWTNLTTPATPNTDFVVTHNLGRVPAGVIVALKGAAVDIYNGSVVASKTTITLRATVSTTVRLFVFLLLVMLTIPTNAQNVRKDDVALQTLTQNTSAGTTTFVTPIPGAVITVCLASGTGIPCTPLANVCSSSTDVTCNQPNPISADVNGNYGFWVRPGRYQVSITATNVNGKLVTYDLAVGQDNNNNTFMQSVNTPVATVASLFGVVSANFLAGGNVDGVGNQTTGGEIVPELTNGGFNKSAQNANLGTTTVVSSALVGQYRACAYAKIITRDPVSSTLPSVSVTFQDVDTSNTITLQMSPTSTVNTTSTVTQGCVVIDVKANSPITYSSSGYVSNTPATMVYSVKFALEAL